MGKHFEFEKLRWKKKSEQSKTKNEKRVRRNLRERERFKRQGDAFSVLSQILPSWLVSKDRKKLSQYKILKFAIEYIELLSRLLNEHDEIEAVNSFFTSN